MIILVDFDGTVVEHEFPNVGKDVPGAVETLRKLVAQGHQLILWTMRSDDTLADAVEWYRQKNIPLFGINVNPEQKVWTNSPKAYAMKYIDDAAVGCPLKWRAEFGKGRVGRPFVDWEVLQKLLISDGILHE